MTNNGDDPRRQFGDHLRSVRVAKGLSQEQLADRSGRWPHANTRRLPAGQRQQAADVFASTPAPALCVLSLGPDRETARLLAGPARSPQRSRAAGCVRRSLPGAPGKRRNVSTLCRTRSASCRRRWSGVVAGDQASDSEPGDRVGDEQGDRDEHQPDQSVAKGWRTISPPAARTRSVAGMCG